MKKSISFKSKYGWISIFEENNKIIEINFLKTSNIGSSIFLKKMKQEIKSFFMKKNKSLEIPLDIKGSKLQKKIWKELMKIPYGKTKSYGEIAKKVNTSPRYVGNVCGQNKHVLAIPCHRVIRADGSLGGFSGLGGINLKKRLINFEKS